MSLIGNLVARFTAETSGFEAGTQRARRSLYDLQRESGATQKALLGIATGAASLMGIGVGIYAVKRAFTSAVQEATNFETGIAKVSTMLDQSSMVHLPRLRSEIERLSIEYGKSTRDLNEAMYSILSSQISASEAAKVLETSIRAAKGGFTDTAVTVRATVGLLKAYQLETDKASYVTNILHKIVQKGQLTFEDVAENIGTVSSTAAVLSVDLEALGATIATITRAGVPVDKTFTAIRNILNTFKTPTEDAIRVARSLGFELDYTSIKGAGLIEVIQKLAKANERQLAVLMPNVRGFEGFAAALQNATDLGKDYAYMLSGVRADEEALAKASAITQDKIDKVTATWKLAKTSFGEQILPPLTFGLEVLTLKLKGLSDAIEQVGSAVRKMSKAVQEDISDMAKTPALGPYATPADILARQRGLLGAWGIRPSPEKSSTAEEAIQRRAIEELRAFKGPLPGTEGVSAIEQMAKQTQEVSSYTEELIAKMQRENELLAMSAEERAKAAAMDKLRAEAQRDYELGIRDSIELTAEETEQVSRLAEEHYKLSETGRTTSIDIARAYVRMYEQIDTKSAESFEARRRLMQLEYEEYAGIIDDQIALQEYRRQMEEKLAIEQAKATGGPLEGFGAGIDDLRRQMQTIGKLSADIAQTGIKQLADAMADAALEGKDLSASLKQVGQQIARMAIEWAVMKLLSGIPIPVSHGGGIAGLTPFPKRLVSPDALADVPRLHGGLGNDEFLAILERGERVWSRAEVAAGRSGGFASSRTESLLAEVVSLLRHRQTISATIVDYRNVMTKEAMEGRDGEQLVMHHVTRNS